MVSNDSNSKPSNHLSWQWELNWNERLVCLKVLCTYQTSRPLSQNLIQLTFGSSCNTASSTIIADPCMPIFHSCVAWASLHIGTAVGVLLFENWSKTDWVLMIYLTRCLYKLLCWVDGWVGWTTDAWKIHRLAGHSKTKAMDYFAVQLILKSV